MTHKKTKDVALETRLKDGAQLSSPSVARNRDAIRDVFLEHMPTSGRALEIGGGTGEHAIHLASATPNLLWHTGDPDPQSRASITAWIEVSNCANVFGPHAIDVTQPGWDIDEIAPLDAVISINMIHIAPIEAAQSLIAGAAKFLHPCGKLFLYGPFRRGGEHTSASNSAFDQDLKRRDHRWGVRDLEQEIAPFCLDHGLALQNTIAMPANNLSVIFGKLK